MSEELKGNVLVVDDEEEFLKVFSQRLQNRGLKVETVTTGEEALKKVKEKDFDAVIIDLVMPGIGGIETLKKIKAVNPELQIIMLSGFGTIEKSTEAIRSGAIDFLEKPADLTKILEKISEAKKQKILLLEKKTQEHIKEIIQSRSW